MFLFNVKDDIGSWSRDIRRLLLYGVGLLPDGAGHRAFCFQRSCDESGAGWRVEIAPYGLAYEDGSAGMCANFHRVVLFGRTGANVGKL